MKQVRTKHSCTGCGVCVSVCAFDAITMQPDAEGFLGPIIDQQKCTDCGACRAACPVDKAAARPWAAALAARALDDTLREASSSGGVFSLLAGGVLARGGVVFGAAFDEDFALRHIGITDEAGLARLRGSKYLQSNLADTFAQAQAALAAGQPVLYSGTPCQIAGLDAFLRKPYENLLTVDMVCHGAPSPGVFAAYLGELQAERGSKITAFAFRDKRRGWKDFSVATAFKDGSEYVAGQREDPFMRAFLQNLCLRESCHACPYAGEKRPADLTLADLWGAAQVLPDWDDDRGLSLVLVGSDKGRAALDAVADQLRLTPVNATDLARANPSIFGPVPPHPRRAKFFAVLKKQGFGAAVAAGLQPEGRLTNLWRRVSGKAKRMINRVFSR